MLDTSNTLKVVTKDLVIKCGFSELLVMREKTEKKKTTNETL